MPGEIQNPLPFLIEKAAPGFTKEETFIELLTLFENSVIQFQEKYKPAIEKYSIPKNLKQSLREEGLKGYALTEKYYAEIEKRYIPKYLKKSILKAFEILDQVVSILKNHGDTTIIYKKVEKLSGGYNIEFEFLKFNDAKFKGMFYDYLQNGNNLRVEIRGLVYDAKRCIEYADLISRENIPISSIPDSLETCDRIMYDFRTFKNISKEMETNLLEIESFMCKIMRAYDYMEKGRAYKTDRNVAAIEELFQSDNNLLYIMLQPFDCERE